MNSKRRQQITTGHRSSVELAGRQVRHFVARCRRWKRSVSSKNLSENFLKRGGQAHLAPKTSQNEPVPGRFRIGSKRGDFASLAWWRGWLSRRRLPWIVAAVAVLLWFVYGCVPRPASERTDSKSRSQQSVDHTKTVPPKSNGSASQTGLVQARRDGKSKMPVAQAAHHAEQPAVITDDPLTELIRQQEQLDDDVSRLVTRMTQKLAPTDAAHLATLHRIHSSGQCLVELDRWSRNSPAARSLEPEDRRELNELLRRWRAWQSELAKQGLME